jgi:hypothetical protein
MRRCMQMDRGEPKRAFAYKVLSRAHGRFTATVDADGQLTARIGFSRGTGLYQYQRMKEVPDRGPRRIRDRWRDQNAPRSHSR